MQKKAIQLLSFIQKIKKFSFANWKNLQSKKKQPLLVYSLHSLKTLPLKTFIDCYVGDNLEGLVISDNCTKEVLQLHFNDLLMEYYDLVGSKESQVYLSLQKSIIKLIHKVNLLIPVVDIYLKYRSDELKNLISKLGFYFQKEYSNELILKQFEGFIISQKVEIEKKQKELNALVKVSIDEQKASRETFITNIVYMAKENFNVNIETDTVEVYAIKLKLFNNYVEQKIEAANG